MFYPITFFDIEVLSGSGAVEVERLKWSSWSGAFFL